MYGQELNDIEDVNARTFMRIADEQVQRMSGEYVRRPKLQEYRVSSVVQNIIVSTSTRTKLASTDLYAFDEDLLPAIYIVYTSLAAKV